MGQVSRVLDSRENCPDMWFPGGINCGTRSSSSWVEKWNTGGLPD